jgi:hypothetical protein
VFGDAAAVLDGQGEALGLVVEPGAAAEVEDPGLGVEDGGDQSGLAGEVAGEGGGDRLAGVQVGGAEAGAEGVEGDGDHHGGGAAGDGGEVVGGEPFEQLAEAVSAPFGACGSPVPGLGLLGGLLVTVVEVVAAGVR